MNVFVAEAFLHTRARLTEALSAVPSAHITGFADSARAAIAAILAQKPDIVLVGLKLAQGSGFDVLREVHSREPGIDIYMVSNFDSEPYRRYAERFGAAGFIDKSAGFGCLGELFAGRGHLKIN